MAELEQLPTGGRLHEAVRIGEQVYTVVVDSAATAETGYTLEVICEEQ